MRGFFAATYSHIFRALPGKRAGIRPQKRCQKQPRKTLSRSEQQASPSRHHNRKTFGYQPQSCAGGAAFLPALDRGQEALDRAHRSNAQCADVCKKLRSPDGFCRGASFHLNKNSWKMLHDGEQYLPKGQIKSLHISRHWTSILGPSRGASRRENDAKVSVTRQLCDDCPSNLGLGPRGPCNGARLAFTALLEGYIIQEDVQKSTHDPRRQKTGNGRKNCVSLSAEHRTTCLHRSTQTKTSVCLAAMQRRHSYKLSRGSLHFRYSQYLQSW